MYSMLKCQSNICSEGEFNLDRLKEQQELNKRVTSFPLSRKMKLILEELSNSYSDEF